MTHPAPNSTAMTVAKVPKEESEDGSDSEARSGCGVRPKGLTRLEKPHQRIGQDAVCGEQVVQGALERLLGGCAALVKQLVDEP